MTNEWALMEYTINQDRDQAQSLSFAAGIVFVRWTWEYNCSYYLMNHFFSVLFWSLELQADVIGHAIVAGAFI